MMCWNMEGPLGTFGKSSKSEFVKREVRYVGRLVFGQGYQMDPKDTM